MSGRAYKLGLLAFVIVASAACSLAIDTDRLQCERDADCATLGFPDMECLDAICVMPEPEVTPFSCRDQPFVAPGERTVDFPFVVVDLIAQTPYQGLELSACTQFDPACEAPLVSATSNEDGAFELSLPEGFRGFLYGPPPSFDEMKAPRILQLFPPPSPDLPTSRADFFMTSIGTVTGLAALAGVTALPDTGHLFFTAHDCRGLPLEGVTVPPPGQPAPDAAVMYIGAGGSLDPGLNATGPAGQGAMLNLPPGYISIRAIHENEGTIFEQSVLIEAGAITSLLTITPSPTQ